MSASHVCSGLGSEKLPGSENSPAPKERTGAAASATVSPETTTAATPGAKLEPAKHPTESAARTQPGPAHARAPLASPPPQPLARPPVAPSAPAPAQAPEAGQHVPVLLETFLAEVSPVRGLWLDATLGGGGYTRALLDAGAEAVIALDRDPEAIAQAQTWAQAYGARLRLHEARFSRLDEFAPRPLAGVVLDLGVSSMQLDAPERGFSFLRDGPLDMRMDKEGPSAADLVNTLPEDALADLLFHYGEERAARRIARAIVKARAKAPIRRTGELATLIAACLPPRRKGDIHPATRSFQALRIAVNAELTELAQALTAAERALAPGGILGVIAFHSLEDRIVKRFFKRASAAINPLDAPAAAHRSSPKPCAPRFEILTKRPLLPSAKEIARNPRARSAKLRLARRTAAPAQGIDPALLGLPLSALDTLSALPQSLRAKRGQR